MEVLGIDVGSYGIKGAIVDTDKGEIISDKKSTDPIDEMPPHKIISKVHKIAKKFKWKGPIGCAFPAPVSSKGVILSADRVSEAWIDADAGHLFSEITNNPVYVINDTDAAGIAEMTYGAGKDQKGTVLVLTIGTGIGSSLFVDGKLVPNTELGLIEVRGISVEERASNKVRKEEGIRRKKWGRRLKFVLENYERVLHPDLFILGGQISKKPDKTFPYIKIATKVKPALFMNEASIIGAAMNAAGKVAVENKQPA